MSNVGKSRPPRTGGGGGGALAWSFCIEIWLPFIENGHTT